ncbi:hypothetical protein NPIL_459471, partial [Nephila pilipes]
KKKGKNCVSKNEIDFLTLIIKSIEVRFQRTILNTLMISGMCVSK